MSDYMLEAVLRMPPNLWSGSEIDVMQRHSRYVQAAEKLAALKRENEELRKELAAQDGWPSDDFLISWRDNEIASLRQQLAEAKQENEALRFYEINSLCDEVETWRQQSLEAQKDAALWKARLQAYLMYRCHADSTARDEILKCELRTLMGENKPTFDEWVAAIDAAIDPSHEGGVMDETYWCIWCNRELPIVDGVIIHDNVFHDSNATFDEEEKPQ